MVYFRVDLMGLKDTERAGKDSLLGMFVRIFPEEMGPGVVV